MKKEIVTYLIKLKGANLYVTNKPTERNEDVSYSTNFNRAREFNGLEDSNIDMSDHIAIKHTHIEKDIYEEVNIDV
ncbi:DUF2483 family protein [uncultured Staphylococcus sp.]|uniref:DUF2483 family protein n=1 Tax=uncultured Staphylococcus sp. TaxID=189668 RepID=UPI0025E58704|nr:DUF2483 family protein [uncultured Staphylococcus sp.]